MFFEIIGAGTSQIFMQFINHSHWNSGTLKKFFMEGLKANGVSHSEYAVVVVYSKQYRHYKGNTEEGWTDDNGNSIHGEAYRGWSNWKKYGIYYKKLIVMFLPKNFVSNPVKIAAVFEHEIAHTRGLRHKEMLPIDSLQCTWACINPLIPSTS